MAPPGEAPNGDAVRDMPSPATIHRGVPTIRKQSSAPNCWVNCSTVGWSKKALPQVMISGAAGEGNTFACGFGCAARPGAGTYRDGLHFTSGTPCPQSINGELAALTLAATEAPATTSASTPAIPSEHRLTIDLDQRLRCTMSCSFPIPRSVLIWGSLRLRSLAFRTRCGGRVAPPMADPCWAGHQAAETVRPPQQSPSRLPLDASKRLIPTPLLASMRLREGRDRPRSSNKARRLSLVKSGRQWAVLSIGSVP